MKAIVTVIGKDHVGITAAVCSLLAQHNINILDITQTVLQGYFTMTMVVDVSDLTTDFDTLVRVMADYGTQRSLSIRVQREDIFDAMHKI